MAEKIQKEYILWHMKLFEIQVSVSIEEVLSKYSYSNSFTYYLWLQRQSWIVAAKTILSAKPKIFYYLTFCRKSLPTPGLLDDSKLSLLTLFIYFFLNLCSLVIWNYVGFHLLNFVILEDAKNHHFSAIMKCIAHCLNRQYSLILNNI